MLDEDLLNSDDLASSSSDESVDQPSESTHDLNGISQESDTNVNSKDDSKVCSRGKKIKNSKVTSFSC